MKTVRPLPRVVTRPLTVVVLVAWVASMAVLVNRSYLQASPASLATDLARYGSTAVWKGVYYRGEKIGFTVSQTIRTEEGFELQEDGRLQMMLLGADDGGGPAHDGTRRSRTSRLQSFEFSLDPGTGAVQVSGRDRALATRPGGPHRLTIWVTSAGTTRAEQRELRRTAGALSEPVTRARQRRSRRRQAARADDPRSGDAAERSRHARGRPARARARR